MALYNGPRKLDTELRQIKHLTLQVSLIFDKL